MAKDTANDRERERRSGVDRRMSLRVGEFERRQGIDRRGTFLGEVE